MKYSSKKKSRCKKRLSDIFVKTKSLVAGDCISSAPSADSFIVPEFPLLSKLSQKMSNCRRCT